MTRLTKRRLEAMEFALGFVLAGDVDETLKPTGATERERVTADDLEAASNWVAEKLYRRKEGEKDR